MTTKVICTFEIEIDGIVPPDDAIEMALLNQLNFGIITSENYDGSEDWSIPAKSLTVEVEHDQTL